MADKKDKDKYDEIILDTTQLKIDIKTTGDLITKEYDPIPFHPNMADLRDIRNNYYILFPSFVKITMKDLKKAGAGDDYPNIFMNLEKYIKLIKYVTSIEREEDFTLFIDRSQVKNYAASLLQNSLTDLISDETTNYIVIQKYEPLTADEIITNNIELIKNIFLPVKSHFFILGNEYIIGQSKYIDHYVASSETNKDLPHLDGKGVPLAYNVKFELQLLDAANNSDANSFSRMSCKAKKSIIAKDAMDLFGKNFGYKPEVRSSVPSILNTSAATQNRKFGKLQKEWEERNKYVKAPTNERERLEIERKWTPLQRKMADFEKSQVDYNKIPPLWIKETEDLDKKYVDFKKDLGTFWDEMQMIKANNPANAADTVQKDMIDLVGGKIRAAAEKVLENTRVKRQKEADKDKTEDDIKEEDEKENEKNVTVLIEAIISADNKEKANHVADTFITHAKEKEMDTINYRYIIPLLTDAGLDKKRRDYIALKNTEDNIRKKLKPGDIYGNKAIEVELAKVQAERIKAQAALQKLQTEFGFSPDSEQDPAKRIVTGAVKAKKWRETLEEKNKLIGTLEAEKSIGEKRIKVESVNKELDEKLKEIKDLKKNLLLAKFYEGNYAGLSKSDKESYEKKSMKDKPLESAETLQSNLNTANHQYLDIAGKFSEYNKVQALITLLNSDLAEFKSVKDSWKSERDTKEKDISKKLADIASITKSASDAAKSASDAAKGGTPSSEEQKSLTDKTSAINKDIDLIQKEINEKINPVYNAANEKYELYSKYIADLKKLKEYNGKEKNNEIWTRDTEKIKKTYDDKIAAEFDKDTGELIKHVIVTAQTTIGGKLLRRTRKRKQSSISISSKRKRYSPNRYIITKNKIIKKRSGCKRIKKHKRQYTLRKRN